MYWFKFVSDLIREREFSKNSRLRMTDVTS